MDYKIEALKTVLKDNSAKLVKITKKQAEDILDNYNSKNRVIRGLHVLTLYKEMKSGNWKKNGDTIKFGPDGMLLDGQHRLRAQIMYGKDMEYLAVVADKESFATIDRNLGRKVSDDIYIGHNRISNSHLLGAIGSLMLRYNERNILYKIPRGNHLEINKIVNKNLDDMIESISFFHNVRGLQFICTKSILCFFRLITKRISEDDSNAYFEKLIHGSGLSKDDPMLYARDFLKENRHTMAHHHPAFYYSILATAWNLLRKKEKRTTKKSFTGLNGREYIFVELK